ncbi:YjgP/YjgQ family permease [bacterium]|nr:MAG: YjgP/YjgQ family permease [bacterium]
MRILDRYILKSVVAIFLSCLLAFFFLYIIIDIFSHLDEILKHRASLSLLFRYYISYLPIIFVQVAPVVCLLATLYTFGRLNHNNEIIAMRSAGLSLFQIIKVAIIFGFLISIFVFFVNDKFVPQSLSLTESIKEEMEKGSKKVQAKEYETINNLSMYGLNNRLYFINRFTPFSKTMEGITILEHDEKQNLTKKIVANKGIYRNGLWRFYQSITYNLDKRGQIKDEPHYLEEETMTIPETPEDFLSQRQRPDFMTIAQLDDYIWKLSKSGATTTIRNFKIDLYQRFTMPLTSVIIVILGLPFSLMMKKRATGLSSLGVSIMVGFVYYVLNAIGLALGKAGILIPSLSVSLSHIIALTTGLYLLNSLP